MPCGLSSSLQSLPAPRLAAEKKASKYRSLNYLVVSRTTSFPDSIFQSDSSAGVLLKLTTTPCAPSWRRWRVNGWTPCLKAINDRTLVPVSATILSCASPSTSTSEGGEGSGRGRVQMGKTLANLEKNPARLDHPFSHAHRQWSALYDGCSTLESGSHVSASHWYAETLPTSGTPLLI